MPMTAALILGSVVFLLLGLLIGYPFGLIQGEKDASRHWMGAYDRLVEKLSEMQKLGFSAIPSSDGDVWPITNEYEVEVERQRLEKAESEHRERIASLGITEE